MKSDDDAAIVAALVDELQRCEHPIELFLRPSTGFHLAGLLQLALRHPNLSDVSREVALTYLAHIRGYFRDHDATTVLDVLRRGDDPSEDR